MRIARLVLVALAIVGVTAHATLGQSGPIKIGTIFPLSGGAGPNGQAVTNAVKVAVDLINKKGGVLGRQLVVVSKDDESTPASSEFELLMRTA